MISIYKVDYKIWLSKDNNKIKIIKILNKFKDQILKIMNKIWHKI